MKLAPLLMALACTDRRRAAAQVNPYKDPTPGVSGYRAEVLGGGAGAGGTIYAAGGGDSDGEIYVGPAADVRSVAEVFLHVAARITICRN
jgi:hypothetical protein